MAIINDKSNLRSRLGYLAYEDIQSRVDDGLLDQYDVVLVKDRDTAAFIAPDGTIHDITARMNAYMSESTAIRALNSSATTYVGMPVAIWYQGSYKLYIADGTPGNWEVLPAWGNPVNFSYNELVDVPVINKVGTIAEPVILSELANGIYVVVGTTRVISSSEIITLLSPELVVVKNDGTSIQRMSGEKTHSYEIDGGEVKEAEVTTDDDVYERIDEQFNERLEETSSESIQDLFN